MAVCTSSCTLMRPMERFIHENIRLYRRLLEEEKNEDELAFIRKLLVAEEARDVPATPRGGSAQSKATITFAIDERALLPAHTELRRRSLLLRGCLSWRLRVLSILVCPRRGSTTNLFPFEAFERAGPSGLR